MKRISKEMTENVQFGVGKVSSKYWDRTGPVGGVPGLEEGKSNFFDASPEKSTGRLKITWSVRNGASDKGSKGADYELPLLKCFQKD